MLLSQAELVSQFARVTTFYLPNQWHAPSRTRLWVTDLARNKGRHQVDQDQSGCRQLSDQIWPPITYLGVTYSLYCGEAFAHFTPFSGNVELLFQRPDKKYSPYCEYKFPLQSCPNCIDVLTWIAGTKHCSAISALTTRNLPSICHTEICCVPSRSEASDCKVARFAVPLVPGTVGVCSASSAWHCWRDWITAATLLTTDQPTWWCRPPIGQISSSALEKSKKQNLSMKFYTKASLGLLPWWFIFLLSPP